MHSIFDKVPINLLYANGDISRTVTLDELVSTGDSYQLFLQNYGKVGSDEFEIIVWDEEQIKAKIDLGKQKRQKRANTEDHPNVILFSHNAAQIDE